jgi:hypothetical protein
MIVRNWNFIHDEINTRLNSGNAWYHLDAIRLSSHLLSKNSKSRIYRTIIMSVTFMHSSPSIIRIIKSRRMRWAGHVTRMGEKRNVYMLLVGNPEGKRPLGRPRHRWIDNIKIDLLEIGLSVVD